MKQFVADGKQPLSRDELAILIPTTTIHLESINFDGEVHYQADGRLIAKNRLNETETGRWEINKDNQLCMKFVRWYYGDLRCYGIIHEDADTYIFFTTNGARHFTGRLQAGPRTLLPQKDVNQPADEAQPGTTGQTQTAGTVKDGNADDTTSPRLSGEEMNISLRYLARNCPGCKLSGLNLQNAQLVAANLAGADLARIDLSGANLRRANLAGANLAGARMVRANLSGADLTGCDLSGADLTGSNLIRANVTDAKLEGTLFTGALLEHIQGLDKEL